MACGKPVIAFKTGGIPEMIQHKKTGWLAEPGYEQGLTEGITWLSQNNHAEEYGLNALQFAQQEYAPNRIANSYIQLYKSLLSK
jgi:glycosyltransferase involved in cell wall biosynthesis